MTREEEWELITISWEEYEKLSEEEKEYVDWLQDWAYSKMH